MNSPDLQSKTRQARPQIHPRVNIRILAKAELQKPLLAFAQSPQFQGLSFGGQSDALRQRERELLSQLSGISQNCLFDLEQVHGTKAVLLEGPGPSHRPRADALFTAKPGIGLVVRTADCLPVFFALEGGKSVLVAGAIHSGWRGTKEQITSKTLAKALLYAQTLLRHKPRPEEKLAWRLYWAIGPAISQKNYEVGREIAAHFSHCKPSNKEGHFLLDLSAEVRDQVGSFCKKHEIEESYDESWEACVFQETDRYFSHRRGDQFRNLNMIEIIAEQALA